MSLVPLLVNLAHELENETNAFDNAWENDFGFGIHPVDLFRPRHHHHHYPMMSRRRFAPYTRSMMVSHRPSRQAASGKGGDIIDGHSSSHVPTIGKEGFQVCMDVSHFKPNELTVKTVDNTIVVEGKHEEREDDHGMIQRHFVRKYTLPKDYDAKEVVSTISSDGVLTLKAPLPPNKAIKHNERIVQIQQTGPAHLSVKAPEESANEKGQAQNGGNSREKAAATAK